MDAYLLFQWTDEREAKIHLGIYSTAQKAKNAAQLGYDAAARRDGEKPRPLDWLAGFVDGSTTAESDFGNGGDDGLYEIEEYTMDTVLVVDPDAGVPEQVMV